MKQKQKLPKDQNFAKTKMSLRIKCYSNLNVSKIKIEPTLKCDQNFYVNRTERRKFPEKDKYPLKPKKLKNKKN